MELCASCSLLVGRFGFAGCRDRKLPCRLPNSNLGEPWAKLLEGSVVCLLGANPTKAAKALGHSRFVACIALHVFVANG